MEYSVEKPRLKQQTRGTCVCGVSGKAVEDGSCGGDDRYLEDALMSEMPLLISHNDTSTDTYVIGLGTKAGRWGSARILSLTRTHTHLNPFLESTSDATEVNA